MAQTEYACAEEYTSILPDTVKLKEVTVVADKKPGRGPFKVMKINPETAERYASDDLGSLLGRATSIQIKTYGPGNLATPVFRGTSAVHTQTTWNGLALNSPMLGQSDFGLLPAFIADEISVSHGIASLANGSGAMGGMVSLESKPDFSHTQGHSMRVSGGSFGRLSCGAGASFSNGKWQSRTKLQYDRATNDYPYPNTYLSGSNPPEEIRQDADWKRLAWGQDFYLRSGNNNLLSVNAWGQNYERSIPVPISSPPIPGNEWLKQDDISIVAGWKHQRTALTSRLSLGGNYSYYHYHQESGKIESTAATSQFMLRHRAEYYLGATTRLESEISLGRQQVNTSNYENLKHRNQASVWLQGIRQFGDFAELHAGLRKDLVDGYRTPLLPSVGLSIFPARKNNLFVSAGWGANHRIPTFNDLYWVPGGNPGLEPEKGYTTEFSVGYDNPEAYRETFSVKISAFNTSVSNRIEWLPDTAGTHWSPRNLKKVHSRGLESRLEYQRKWQNWKLEAVLSWNLTLATDQNSNNGLQLPYTPIHSLNAGFELSGKNYRFDYAFQFTGQRYITNNPGQMLPSVGLHDAGVSYEIPAAAHRISLSLRIFNVLNTPWQSIIWQPMPGRHYRLTLVYRFEKAPAS